MKDKKWTRILILIYIVLAVADLLVCLHSNRNVMNAILLVIISIPLIMRTWFKEYKKLVRALDILTLLLIIVTIYVSWVLVP